MKPSSTLAVMMREPGSRDVLELVERPISALGTGQALVGHKAIGVNYVDIQHRSGRYPLPSYPHGIGMEAAGIVLDVAPDISDIRVGDRVAYAAPPPGAYCGMRVVPADRLVPLPNGISFEVAAAILLKGLTAHYLVRGSHHVRPGDVVLVHAAAGGVGTLLTRWALSLGASVIGTVGGIAKIEAAKANGCAHVIDYKASDFAAEVRRLTKGRGVDVVYDSVGATTFEGSLRSLAPKGLLVSYGTPSGPIPPFDIFRLNQLGSLFVTSPSIFTYVKERSELLMRAAALFEAIDRGVLAIDITHRLPLSAAAEAHRLLESRATTGALVLVPDA